jgi:hypothetical protein
MEADDEYREFVESSAYWSPLVFEILKEVAVEAVKKIANSYLPSAQAQNLVNAIAAISKGDYVEFAFEVKDIVLKKFPGVSAVIDGAGLALKLNKIHNVIGHLPTASLERLWSIASKSPLKLDPDYIKYVDDLAEPRFGWSNTTDYRKVFDAAFPGVRVDMAVHHASPQNLLNFYPNLGISTSQMHSLENLRGISNSHKYIKPNGQEITLHQHITNSWSDFYSANPTITDINVIFDYAKNIDNQYGHLFSPPVR